MEGLVEVSGAHTIYDGDPLQPILGDLLTITTHIAVQRQGAMVPWGCLMVGLPPGG